MKEGKRRRTNKMRERKERKKSKNKRRKRENRVNEELGDSSCMGNTKNKKSVIPRIN